MKIKVTSCNNCPFCILDYDGNTNGRDSLEYCQLKRFLNRNIQEYFNTTLRVYDSWEEEPNDIDVPEWCPLNELNIIKDGFN